MIKPFLVALVLQASQPAVDAPLSDPAAEARAQALMREIRCVSCENEPISQSASEIARDMRKVVRDQISEGASDSEIRDWFAARYGDFVLFRPNSSRGGAFLWAFPFALLVFAMGALWAFARARRNHDLAPLSPDEVDSGPDR